MTIEAKGFSSLMLKLDLLKEATAQKVIVAAAKEAMKPVLQSAQLFAPKDSGTMAAGLVLKADKTLGSGAGVGGAGIKPTGPHSHIWHFAEFGTSKQPAHPFLRPAMAQNAQQAVDIFKSKLKEGIDRAVRKQHAASIAGQLEALGSAVAKTGKKLGRKARKLKRTAKKLARKAKRGLR